MGTIEDTIEDIEDCVRSGRRPRDDEPYRIKIGNPEFDFEPTKIFDPVPTGRQVIEAAKKSPAEEFVILQLLMSGAIEELRLDETVDLRDAGIESFIVAKADTLHRFGLNDHIINWPVTPISGEILLKLARKDGDFEVVQELQDEPDKVISIDDFVELDREGTERFYTQRKNTVTIVINGTPHEVPKKKEISHEEVASLAYPDAQNAIFSITYMRGHGGKEGILAPGGSVKVKEGMAFRVDQTGQS